MYIVVWSLVERIRHYIHLPETSEIWLQELLRQKMVFHGVQLGPPLTHTNQGMACKLKVFLQEMLNIMAGHKCTDILMVDMRLLI